MSDYLNISLKLHKEKDKELVDFLDGKPKSWIIKEALKMYMGIYQNPTMMIKEEVKQEVKTDATDLLGKFKI